MKALSNIHHQANNQGKKTVIFNRLQEIYGVVFICCRASLSLFHIYHIFSSKIWQWHNTLDATVAAVTAKEEEVWRTRDLLEGEANQLNDEVK